MSEGGTVAVVMDPEAEQAAQEVFGLSDLQRRFTMAYFSGEHAGNGTKCWMEVSGEPNYNSASVVASEMLKNRKVRAFLAHLTSEATTTAVQGKLRPWEDLLPMAQGVVVATAQGKLRNRLAYEAAIHILDRALGRPVERQEVEHLNRERVTTALRSLTRRVIREQRVVLETVEEDHAPTT